MDDFRERSAFMEQQDQAKFLSRTLYEQRVSCRFCDVILKVCGHELYAHSNVLAAASPYFGSFLGNGQDKPRAFSQCNPQIIEIHIDGTGTETDGGYGNAVSKVVDFMYTGELEVVESTLLQVMEIANIMQMKNIIEFCENFSKHSEVQWIYPSDCVILPSLENVKDIDVLKICAETQTDFDNIANISKSQINDISVADDSIIYLNKHQMVIKSIHEKNKSFTTIKPRKKHKSSLHGKQKLTEFSVKRSRDNLRSIIRKPIWLQDGDSDEDIQQNNDFVTDEPENNVVLSEFTEHTTEKDSILKEHEQMYAIPLQTSTADLACNVCGVIASSVRALNNHTKWHKHSENVCSFCDFHGSTKEEFDSHLANKHSGPKPHYCTFCDATFKTKTQLNFHLPKHSDEKPFTCPHCGVGFKWKHALKSHTVIHTNTKNHLCDVCGWSTAHKSLLKAHKLVHTGETFKCPYTGCAFQATKRPNLKYHLITHTQEKPHQCYVCGQSFSLAKNMKRHMLLHSSSDSRLQCDRCSFETTRYDKLREHLHKQHSVGTAPGKRRRLTDYLGHGRSLHDSQRNEITASDSSIVCTEILTAGTDVVSTDVISVSGEAVRMEEDHMIVTEMDSDNLITYTANISSDDGNSLSLPTIQVINVITEVNEAIVLNTT